MTVEHTFMVYVVSLSTNKEETSMTLNPPANPSTSSSMISSWLAPHRTTFLESLAEQGYSESRMRILRRFTDCLCAEARTRDLVPDGLDAEVFRTLADTCPKTGAAYMEWDLAMVARRFTDHLVQAGVVAAVSPPQPIPGSPEQLCEELDHWLRHHRGMFGSRLPVYRNQLKDFLSFCCTTTGTAEDLASLTPDVLFVYLHRCSGKSRWRIPYVRNLLRFLFYSDRTPQDLSTTIPRMATTRPPGGLPRHLEPDVVEKLLEGLRGNQPRALRNVAMFLLMARLGLRAQEVIALRLEDIDWGAGRMLIRGKGQQRDHMPIPVDVGEALVAWLRDGRKGNARHLFVCVRAPYAPLASSLTFRRALRTAYKQAGLIPPQGKVRVHALRHSLAMKLLGQGSSLEEIGDVLRHRSIQSTTVYARYDLDALRPLARPWPVPGGVQ